MSIDKSRAIACEVLRWTSHKWAVLDMAGLFIVMVSSVRAGRMSSLDELVCAKSKKVRKPFGLVDGSSQSGTVTCWLARLAKSVDHPGL